MFVMPTNPEIRAMVNVEILARTDLMTTWQNCKRAGIRSCAKDRAIKSVVFTVIRANGAVQLVKVGPRGGRKVLHNFGIAHH